MNPYDKARRMNEFTWYHNYGDGDCNGQVLKAYASAENLSRNDMFDLAYFYAATYCCVSAVYLLQNRQSIVENPARFAKECKKKLIFQSDRKYVRMLDHFEKMLDQWSSELRGKAAAFDEKVLKAPDTVDTVKALEAVERWYFFSRFSAYLFVETYCDIFGLKATRAQGMSYEGDNMTFAGGLFYVFNRDIEARFVHEHRRLPVPVAKFEDMIHELQSNIRIHGGDDSLVKLETSLCAYEKFFKGTRYNGFYADRQLEEIEAKKNDPEFSGICTALLQARSRAIDDRYLGERHGWHGIQPHLKKSYRETGEIIGYRG